MSLGRALVTGGAGFVGSHLVDALLSAGHEVTVLDNLDPQAHEDGVPRFLNEGARLVTGDLRDRTAVADALEGVEVVFHQGGMVGNGQSMYEMASYVDVNATGTAVLLEEVLRRRDTVRRVVAASSMVVYGDGAYRCDEHGTLAALPRRQVDLDAGLWEPRCPWCLAFVHPVPTDEDFRLRPTSPYGIGKAACEQLVLVAGEAHQIECVALRYLNVYGPRQALGNPYTGVAAVFCTRLLSRRPPLVFEDGAQQRDLVHVDDVVRANLLAMSADAAVGCAINVGTGTSITVGSLALILAGSIAPGIAPEISGRWRSGDIRHCWADTGRARSLLGFVPRTDRAAALSELAQWVANERPVDRTEQAFAELISRGLIR